jgi:dolichol kinase
MKVIDNGSIEYKDELMRKSIHLCSLSIPVIYYFIEKDLALKILVPLALVVLFIDVGRFYSKAIARFVDEYFGFLLRDHEKDKSKKNLNGATYVLLSAALVVFVFPKYFAITAFTILIISDILAALVGRKYGKHRFLFKSLEGTLAFFISACIVVLFTPKFEGLPVEYFVGFAAAAIGAIFENISYGWADDNMAIPISVGISLWVLYYFFIPQLVPPLTF